MFGRFIGSTVSASFGLMFLLMNSGRLPDGVALAIRVTGIVLFALFILIVASRRHAIFGSAAEGDGRPFGGHFWLIVALEVLALFGGLFLLNNVFGLPQAAVAWIAIVVGLHFVPMAMISGERFFAVLAALMTPAGVIGLVLAATGASAVTVDIVAGLFSGVVLTAAAWWGLTRILRDTRETRGAPRTQAGSDASTLRAVSA